MKSIITFEDTSNACANAVFSLEKYQRELLIDNNEALKLANSYYEWIVLKTNLIKNENTFKIPVFALPNTFSRAAYEWLRPEKQKVFNRYYRLDNDTDKYVIAVKKDNIANEDIDLLMHSMVLTRKSVVWVEFGVNIGAEFGGRHPAIILKNLDDSVVVIPLSSQEPDSDKYNVKIDSVYGFPSLTRWANVTRIREVDISRIDFSCRIGNVNSKVMKEISDKMYSCGMI